MRTGEAYEYGAAFDRAAAEVLGEELAARVRRDLLTLQDRGLDRLGERRATLRERYAAFDHPAAREICCLARRAMGRHRRTWCKRNRITDWVDNN